MNNVIIVAIGSSAGGLAPLVELFDTIHHDKVSYVILRHIPVAHQSELQQILQRHSKLQIVEVENGMQLKKDMVYIPPPFAFITVRNNIFYLHNRIKENGVNWIIDIFLESLVSENGLNSMAVILSGAGSDGSKGISLLKQAGGMVIVQNPGFCEHPAMPINALKTGNVDYVLRPCEMPSIIQQQVSKILKTKHHMEYL